MTTTLGHDAPARQPVDPTAFGIGARISVHPAGDDFVDVILGAIDDVEQAGLTAGLDVQTETVSTYAAVRDAPAEQRLADYLTGLIAATARRLPGGHAVAHVLLSRGCPGEVTCDLRVSRPPQVEPVALADTGIPAVIQWSLYPLLDGGHEGEHLPLIEEAITTAQADPSVEVTATHYATLLRGDLAAAMAVAVNAWSTVGTGVPHVVSHLTISIGSPSEAVA